MRYKLLSLLGLLALLGMGCSKTKNLTPKPSALQGTYTGQFVYIHIPQNGKKPDTLKALIQLNLTSSLGFSVTGDTSTVHAGSRGLYELTTSATIQFFDQTYPTSGIPLKKHLSGQYQYTFDGTYLDLLGADPTDTLTYSYFLIKQ